MAWEYSTGQVCQDLAWEKLHTGNWKTVSPVWRDLFSYACLVAALVHLQQLDPSLHEAQALIMSEGGIGTEAASSSKPKGDSPQKAVATAMHELDMAAIMGGPLFRTEIDSLIYAVQSLHQQRLDTFVAHTPVKRRFDVISSSDRPDSCCKQRKAPVHRSQTKQQTSDKLPGKVSVARFAHYVDSGNAARQQVQQLTEDPALLPPGSLLPHCTRVPSEQLPSMERKLQQQGVRADSLDKMIFCAPSRQVKPVVSLCTCRFLVHYMLVQDKGQPVVVTGAMSSWPALSRWQDLGYLSRVAGLRTVPVELGKHYLAEGWGQKLMLFADFVKHHVQREASDADTHSDQTLPLSCSQASPLRSAHNPELERQAAANVPPSLGHPHSHQVASVQPHVDRTQQHTGADQEAGCALSHEAQPETRISADAQLPLLGQHHEAQEQVSSSRLPQAVSGYLAQHPLFDQIPDLRNDIQEPMYCALGEGEMQSINAWFGPAGTAAIMQVTPLHHDPHYNLLAQVVGTKYVRLYHPKDSANLYPYQTGLTQNSSQVEVDHPDFNAHPEFAKLVATECVLQPGQMLFIPPGWWHYVKALSVSFSVSFWWQ
ncbi:TPA: hypothetical protein ACH3X2_004395 [Trebouxia sp. C0005]